MSEVFGHMLIGGVSHTYLRCLFRGLQLQNLSSARVQNEFADAIQALLVKLRDGGTVTQQELDDALAASRSELVPCEVNTVHCLQDQGRKAITLTICGGVSLVLEWGEGGQLGLLDVKIVHLVTTEGGEDRTVQANWLLFRVLTALAGCPTSESGSMTILGAEVTTIDGWKAPLSGALAHLVTRINNRTEPANYLKSYPWFAPVTP